MRGVGTMSICQSFMTFYQGVSGPAVYQGQCSPSSSDYLGGHAVKIVGYAHTYTLRENGRD
jgi:hypothetical protein